MERIIENNQLTLIMTEGLTANKIPEYNQQLESLLLEQDHYQKCILNLSQTNNIDSTGVTFVISLYKKMKSLEKEFTVIGAGEEIQDLFRLMKLDQFFELKE